MLTLVVTVLFCSVSVKSTIYYWVHGNSATEKGGKTTYFFCLYLIFQLTLSKKLTVLMSNSILRGD